MQIVGVTSVTTAGHWDLEPLVLDQTKLRMEVGVQPDCTNLELGTLPYSIIMRELTTPLPAEPSRGKRTLLAGHTRRMYGEYQFPVGSKSRVRTRAVAPVPMLSADG